MKGITERRLVKSNGLYDASPDGGFANWELILLRSVMMGLLSLMSTSPNLSEKSHCLRFVVIAMIFLCRVSLGFLPCNGGWEWNPIAANNLVGDTHQSITEKAIKSYTFSEDGTCPAPSLMMKALSQIAQANADVDKNQRESALHFDGENFAGGQKRILKLREDCIQALRLKHAQTARIFFGQALHTLQDFYSHSTWVENHGPYPLEELGVPGRTIPFIIGAQKGSAITGALSIGMVSMA
jgi:hypothetical protein